MHTEYHKWFSERLQCDMELKVYGHYGKPVLIFPTQGGRYHESEDYGIIGVLEPFINGGKIKVVAPDSIDYEAWAHPSADVNHRAYWASQYEGYITHEVVPFISVNCNNNDIRIVATGFSMGAYHAANFFFKHPYVFDKVIAISGMYDLKPLLGEFNDDAIYYNSPLFYLRNLEDHHVLEQLRQNQIIIATGQGLWEEDAIADTHEIKSVLEQKSIPAQIDFWGHDVDHDWVWWRKMLPHYIGIIGV